MYCNQPPYSLLGHLAHSDLHEGMLSGRGCIQAVGPVTEARRGDPLPSPSWGSEARALEDMKQVDFRIRKWYRNLKSRELDLIGWCLTQRGAVQESELSDDLFLSTILSTGEPTNTYIPHCIDHTYGLHLCLVL
jgi:hypothetical protein